MRCGCGPLEQAGVPQGDLVRPEHVTAARAECVETPDKCGRRLESAHVRRIRQDADQAIFRQRAGCPAGVAMSGEPGMSGFVMDVIWIEQRHQDVDVQ